MMPGHGGHDIVVIGASAGGVEALRRLVAALPEDFPAAVFIVVHVGASSFLSQVLDRAGRLPVAQAVGGEPIVPGRGYVAAPGAHLLLHDGHVLLRRGPRENLVRPAIDPLFRSAAASFGGRVIGVVLTGSLNDGSAGLLAVKRCGGLAVVQDPADAAFPDMPASALRHVDVDHVSGIAGMAELLGRLVREPAGPTPAVPLEIRLEAAVAAQESGGMDSNDRLGSPSPFTCPDCQGTLWEIEDGTVLRYRCHVGHAHTAVTALAGRDGEIDRTLATLVRSHQERAVLARRLAERERGRGPSEFAARLDERASDYESDLGMVRRLFDRAEARAAAVEALQQSGAGLRKRGDGGEASKTRA